MEDILASIRRIIAADHSGPGAQNGFAGLSRRNSAATVTVGAAESDRSADEGVSSDDQTAAISEGGLVSDHAAATAEASSLGELASSADADPATDDALIDGESGAVAAEPAENIYDPHASRVVVAPERAEPLLSPSVGASISSSFQALAESVLFRDPETLERMARDALRPMLKTWLDDNLPSMVERLVRAEIERVARGGRTRD